MKTQTITRQEIKQALRAKNLVNNRSKYIAISVNGEPLWVSKNVAIHVLSDSFAEVDIQEQSWKGLGIVKVIVVKVFMTF